MKITIIGPVFPYRGGIAHHTALLAGELKKKHDVQVINFKRQYPEFLFPGKTQMETGENTFGIESKRIIDSVNPLTWRRAANETLAFKTDLLIIEYWMPFFGLCFGRIARSLRRKSGAKIMMICHNLIPHEKRIGDVSLTNYAIRPTDFFITQSETVTNDLLRLKPGAKYKQTPHPLYDFFGSAISRQNARQSLGIQINESVVLFFGFIRKYKGLDNLIRALPRVLDKLQVKLVVAGEFYEDESFYRDLIRDLNLEDSVIVFPDYCPNEKVGEYFSACDVVALPYRTATQSGIVQIAYHFNKPVIVTDVGGLGEMVIPGKTGFVVPPDEPTALADAIIRFFSESTSSAMTGPITEEKKKYTWNAFAEAVEKLAKES